MKLLSLTGKTFGRWKVIEFSGNRNINGASRRYWLCKCSCGTEQEVLITSLTSGNSKSCGCLKLSLMKTHGLSNSKEYRIWWAMIQRCRNPKHARFHRYGGRGITVCARWKRFELFYSDMGKRPSRSLSIDRMNNSLGYYPSNCRWATRSQQQKNKG